VSTVGSGDGFKMLTQIFIKIIWLHSLKRHSGSTTSPVPPPVPPKLSVSKHYFNLRLTASFVNYFVYISKAISDCGWRSGSW